MSLTPPIITSWSGVLHNWSDADCKRIMRAARAAMEPGARLLVVDQILNADPANGELQNISSICR